MEANQELEVSMAASIRTRQVARLRTFLVISYVALSATAIVAAFILSWFGLQGAPWFLATGTVLGLWASVTATCHRVAAGDLLHVANVLGQKNLPQQRDAA